MSFVITLRCIQISPLHTARTALLNRALDREQAVGHRFPAVDVLDMGVTSTVADTHTAARMMAEEGVAAIIVLGGDGTHRAAVSCCGGVPIAGLSTGTNNAYPELRESTITGFAVGLYATGQAPVSVWFRPSWSG